MTIMTPPFSGGSPPPSSLVTPTSNADKPKKISHADSQKLVGWIQETYASAKNDRTKDQLQWQMNMVFYRGDQYQEYLAKLNKLTRPPAPPHRVRHVSNRIRPLIRTELARLTSQKPNASVVPASSEDNDLFAAQAGEQVWESIYFRKKINAVFGRAAWWTLMTGTGFVKTYWDNSMFDKVSGTAGDLCYESITPFHIFVPDTREETMEGQPFVLHVYTRSLEWARNTWGSALPDGGKDLKANVVSSNEILEGAYLNLGSEAAKPDSVLITEAWIKKGAHKLFPEGGMVTLVDNQVVQVLHEYPYMHQEFPFTKFSHIPNGKFYADSTIVDVIPLQREYNRTRSQIIEAKNRMAKPQLLAAKGSIDPRKITTMPGQVIEYQFGFPPPSPLPLQPLPAYVLQELQTTLVDIEDISGQHQVSKGSAPPGVTAATAISFLQERDDSLMSHTFQSVEEGMESIARQSLQLFVQYADASRMIKTVGTDGAFNVQQLAGADIAKGTDIRIEGGSALPVSKAAKQAFVMDMMKLGFIPPQEGLKLLEMGGIQALYDQLKIDERQAQRENLRMRQINDEQLMQHEEQHQQMIQQMQMQMMGPEMGGMPPEMGGDPTADPNASPAMTPDGEMLEAGPVVPVNDFDNHQIHIEIHNRFRKSAAFEMLDDKVKAQFQLHVEMHKAAAMGAMQDEMLGQMSAMGGPMGGEEMSGEEMDAPPVAEEQGGGNQFTGVEGMEM